ncbi:hypothetical protein BB561_006797 [Smittium simulii]|uniref:Orotidine 5'-phosphate decarboxylase n=1 Tax=Smittium simulii TaxID=133385 RepID=A0A2T9Y1F6_9FUNG|nr:hypothetical protein BB561_006797 [Smittium simulii]
MDYSKQTYQERAEQTPNALTKRLFSLMAEKKTNLCLSIDVTTVKEILALADKLGPYICVLKTHVDIIEDFTYSFTQSLLELAIKHNFLIFEDRKFADIGNTVKSQYGGGIYRIADWASITNCHTLPGPGIIDGLRSIGKSRGNGLLLLAEMSSADNLFSSEYTHKTVALALENRDFVFGFISQHKLTDKADFVYMTPGVNLSTNSDSLGQTYNTPETAVGVNGADVIIVGRAIYNSPDPVSCAVKYRNAGWNAYSLRTSRL